MRNFNKTIYISLAVVVVFLALAIYAYKFVNNTKPINNNGKTVLSNRDLAIEEVLENADSISRAATINGNTFLLTGYDDTFYGGGPKENRPGWKFGGIIVFKLDDGKPVMFWESEEAMNSGSSRFLDINNDGIPEIFWDGYFGATGRDSAFYVYKFNNTGFKLITPTETIKTSAMTYKQTILGGDSSLTYIKDIDNDKIQEIVVGYRDGEKINQQTYKFNGQEYKLWKEEKVNQ